MKLLTVRKDGGGESSVTGYWLIEAKSLLSVCLLRFDGDSRDAFHTHAFNCVSWLLRGRLVEQFLDGRNRVYGPSWRPFVTRRSDFHKVSSTSVSWVLTFRGPWVDRWREFLPPSRKFVELTHGRRQVH
jgi:hypothetical protein